MPVIKSPQVVFQNLKKNLKPQWISAFGAALLIGLLTHLPIMLSDIPNHDGLASMYFDQNMITSGRWFLTIACGFSSYYTVPWVIGLLGFLFLSCTAVALVEILEVENHAAIITISGMLVTFPTLASTFAYVFTLDGYMMALMLAVFAVFFTKKFRFGFVPGAVCLAFSMGTYQAYLPFAILLSVYGIVLFLLEKRTLKEKIKTIANYLYMGVGGGVLYFIFLRLLLFIQGKELANYQGINHIGGASVDAVKGSITESIAAMYYDFVAFTAKGGVLANNFFGKLALVLLLLLFLAVLGEVCLARKLWKKPMFFVIIVLLAVGVPLANNAIMLISPELNYHLLMRYQWVLYPMFAVAFVSRYSREGKLRAAAEWCLVGAGLVLVFHYALADNIGYSNLEKRYEKTYAYCLRLLDRIEQTEGYYQGIPVAMIGVVGDEQFPDTDITEAVTGAMIGVGGESLLYTGANYEAFMKHYLGATLNFLEPDAMEEMYYTEEYMAMESFPGATSTKVIDGVLYVKTENTER